MPSNNEKPLKKSPGAKFSQSSPIGSVFKFGKRRVSETSRAWSRSASESTTGSPASTNERTWSQSSIPQGDYAASSPGEDNTAPYSSSSQSAVRLVNTRQPSEAESSPGSIGSQDALGVDTAIDATQPVVQSPESTPSRPPTPLRRSRPDASPPPSRTTTPIPSTSRIHWNQLRNAIIPGVAVPSSSRPFVPDTPPPVSSFTTAPPRPQTPKPSRFARLGFRQVVEQTREVVPNELGRFEAEVYQACASARLGDARHKVEREGSQSMLLPFVSTTSLPLSATTAVSQTSKLSQSSDWLARAAPSLKLLHQTLIRYAATSASIGTMVHLPFESEVLSVLQIPFMTETSLQTEERWLAVETFEVAVKSWRGSSRQREVDRVLWCCKAGCIPASSIRSRILGTLSNLLCSSKPIQDADPLSLQNILQGLHTLLYTFSGYTQIPDADTNIVRELCEYVSSGASGQLDVKEIEQEYGADWSSLDTEDSIRDQIAMEGVVRCMQIGSEYLRRWILYESIETYWPFCSGELTPLCKAIMARRLSTFLRSSLRLLRSETTQADRRLLDSDANIIIRLLQYKVLPELEQLSPPRHALDGRALAVELLLELLSIDAQDQRQPIIELICKWCEDVNGWKGSIETAVRLLVEKVQWSHLTRALYGIANSLPEEGRKQIVSIVLPALHMRLVIDPPPYPLPSLTSVLQSFVELYPQQFYKPLFSLAAASRDSTIVGHLHVVTALARYFPDFWIRDSEMMSIALMSDVGAAINKGKQREDQFLTWSKTRIGQSLIMLELIRCVKELTKEKKSFASPPDGSQAQAYRFVTGLETRLAILLDAKEKSVLVPFSQRTLLSILFLEIRLFSRSLKPAPWLQRIVIWATQSYSGANLHSTNNPFANRPESPLQFVGDEVHDEILVAVGKIQAIHVSCWQSPSSHSRRSTMILSASFDPWSLGSTAELPADAEPVKEREELVASLSTGLSYATLRLLVAVCALLTQADCRTLGPALWSQFLDETDPRIVAPACFLLTHCLEKSPEDTTKLLESDRHSSDSVTRQILVRRLMTLYAWRSQLLSQTYIHDRARRPFKLPRHSITFVAIDVGSPDYVHEQTEEDRKNLPGGGLPFELRKRLAEVGWEQDDLPTDIRLEKVRAPISLFPVTQMDHINTTREQDTVLPSHNADSTKQLIRRRSSASRHHPGGKRRPVFVPALVSLFSSVSLLAFDSDPAVASAAREAILVMLRDDPAMLCRPLMDTLSGDLARIGDAISVFRAFLHIHNRLPPSASHHIFCHLGGFLKFVSRDSDTDPKALRVFSYTVPILSKLVNQVSNLSIRDLRRSKFEIYVFPSGPLWFPSTAPPSTMFPQTLGPTIKPLDELPPQLVAICMVRTAQNMFLFDMLKQKPQEVHIIRKTLSGLVLPGENTGIELDARSFLPRRSLNESRRTGYHQVSLALSRSYLLLLEQVFRTMSRNFNSRVELARLFDGLNKILLAHGDDIGIVAHALIACMIGVTRFKRLISSSRGFALFMPSILKVYAEAEHHHGIRHAIQYASSRFYAIHEEVYLFQSVDLASSILVRLDHSKDQDWFARAIWRLFSALKAPLHRGIPDAAAIRDCNRTEEREALIAATVTDESPQRVTQDSPGSEQLKKILASGQYDDKLLQLDDLARLFLTVIAHDHTIIRSQNFLALFRHMAPEFYNGTKSAREVLREGISALGSALFVKTPRHKFFDSNQGRPLQHNIVDNIAHESGDNASVFGDPSTPCDHVIMRREYLSLVLTFTQMGGDLGKATIRRALDLTKDLLKESTRPDPEFEGTFLHKLTECFFSRVDVTVKYAIALLQDVAPVIRAFALSIDCSGLLETVTELLKRSELANNVGFVQFVVDRIAAPVLEACETAASANMLMSLPMRTSVISLVRRTAALGNADVASTIEKLAPSPGFLAGIVLPLCLTIKTPGEVVVEDQWQADERPEQCNIVFLRLLAYAMDACLGVTEVENGRSSPLPALHRRNSERSKQSSLPTRQMPLATLPIVLQIIKVIVVRTGDDLSKGLPGLWPRMARFLQRLLEDGDAHFALPSLSSPTQSPWQSPLLGQSPSSTHARTRSVSSDDHISPSHSNRNSTPRVVDYLMWSLLEFLCCAPSPLTLQLRLWVQEKVHNLDAELKAREVPGPYLGRDSRRLSSSVFARARGSSTSPDKLRASHVLSKTPSELNLSVSSMDFNTYTRFPSSASSPQPAWTGPRIVHLGPTKDHQMFQPVERTSTLDSHLKSLARHTYIKLPSLVQRTRSRIRLVQTCMGYSRLLPLEGQESEPNVTILRAWTRASALTMLAEEAKLLIEEFSESFRETLDENFVDVPSNQATEETQESSPKKQPLLF